MLVTLYLTGGQYVCRSCAIEMGYLEEIKKGSLQKKTVNTPCPGCKN